MSDCATRKMRVYSHSKCLRKRETYILCILLLIGCYLKEKKIMLNSKKYRSHALEMITTAIYFSSILEDIVFHNIFADTCFVIPYSINLSRQ